MASTLQEQLAPLVGVVKPSRPTLRKQICILFNHGTPPPSPCGSLEELIERGLESRISGDDRIWYSSPVMKPFKLDLVSAIPSKSWTYRRIFPNR